MTPIKDSFKAVESMVKTCNRPAHMDAARSLVDSFITLYDGDELLSLYKPKLELTLSEKLAEIELVGMGKVLTV